MDTVAPFVSLRAPSIGTPFGFMWSFFYKSAIRVVTLPIKRAASIRDPFKNCRFVSKVGRKVVNSIEKRAAG